MNIISLFALFYRLAAHSLHKWRFW